MNYRCLLARISVIVVLDNKCSPHPEKIEHVRSWARTRSFGTRLTTEPDQLNAARAYALEGLTTRRHRIRPGVSRRLQPRAKRRATPPLSPNQRARPAARLALEHQARCAGTVERHRDRLEATVMLSPRPAASLGDDLGQDGCSLRLRGVEQQDAADEVRSPRWRPSLLILVFAGHP